MSFKSNLSKLRIEKNISEEEMAKALSCTINEFKELELGTRDPKLQELLAAAKSFGVSTDYLLDNEEEKEEVKKPFDPLSLFAGMALPGGFSINPGDGDDCDDMDEELALELAEMVSAIDIRRISRGKETK